MNLRAPDSTSIDESDPPSPHDQFLRIDAEHEAALYIFIRTMLPLEEDAAKCIVVLSFVDFGQSKVCCEGQCSR